MRQGRSRRYNKGKNRFSLLPAEALEKVVDVYTKGAEKYTLRDENGNVIDDGANNWRKGLPWLESLDSVLRHIDSFKSGKDFDEDLGTYHLANAVFGLLAILTYYDTHPELDNRPKWYKKSYKRVWLDIDEVLADFHTAYLELFDDKTPPLDWDDPRFRDGVELDDDFWLNIPTLATVSDFIYPIEGYCTARKCSNEITRKWLDSNYFPKKRIINVCDEDGCDKKSYHLIGRCDVTVDDSIHHFMDLNSNGIPCYLMTRPHNEKYDVGHLRVHSLREFFEKVRDMEY